MFGKTRAMSTAQLLNVLIGMSDSIICERAFEFASRILKLCDRLDQRGSSARLVGRQLMECGTSIGSNAEEAQEGQTKPDYIAKMSISRKEARETTYWLRLIIKNGYATTSELMWEVSEANQLLAMIRAAIRTAKSSPNRGNGL
ncbi:MAG: four helix bundle protein [Acidobacteria bacterium]|nr:MAG: four helix bundle protein [Acidobacteriota bacterium]